MSLPPLLLAAQSGDRVALARLLQSGADANQPSESGETALMLAAARGAVEAADLLIEHGADVNAESHAGNTALMLASARGQVEVVQFLLAHGARADHKNKYGLGAADWSRWTERQAEVVALLNAPVSA